ncbi:penicillin-binding transpeptidase domain-containing protein [Sporosarcina sp. G11-34]|uniref:penicillin-binding transpeptidase domain-containing protein n=1 Tax=Sporosarcina sp. G11-34 TaxID=2849605 RepID=UPI0022A8D90B|nr:penicillin-binding transpeptidase domain-containing protein [Sporosarcina sp. G11-34]MCZ2259584.1 penicillin-binding transpeptidase domain-containing protein [Sporosarcina sp. G11-34]
MKKWRFITVALILLVALSACSKIKQDTPEDRLTEYIDLWSKSEFEKMYDGYVGDASKQAFGKEEYVDRTKKFYDDLKIKDVKVTFTKPTEEKKYKPEEQAEFPVQIKMETIAGPIEFKKNVALTYEEREEEENSWYVEWDPSFILPDLTMQDKVGISVIPSKRGEIYDRNELPLAINGNGYEIGVVPELFDETADAERLGEILGVSSDYINKQLNQKWVEPDRFVPLKKIALTQNEITETVFEISGVTSREVNMREYPSGQSLAHLVGYIGRVNAEELEKYEDKGYVESDFIGKRGLEQLLEEQLRGKDGIQIYIEKVDHKSEKITIAEKPAQDGESIALTIDAAFQKKTFESMKGEPGTAAVIDPKTGETLVLTSSPAFDPNEFMIGVSSSRYAELTEDPNQPLLNRFAASYAPGSSIKPITSVIGLEVGTLKPKNGHNIEGKTWQKNKSWGDFVVTRLYSAPNPIDLQKGLVYSDNIYFAMEALAMGSESLTKGLTQFGFGEAIPYSYPLTASQISNDGKISSEGQLVDTSFGQGEMLMNIVHLASSYAPIVNEGTMIKPVLFKEDPTGEVWKEGLVSSENAKILQTDLRKVITDGPAKSANIPSIKISGKTGTAELKSDKDKRGKENGFFVAYPTENPSYIIAMMIEGVEDKGGSGHVAEKVAEVMKK